MRILFRYLLREYGKVFTMCFSALMTIYLVIDFFEKVRRFLRYDADWLDVLTYFLLKTPAISYQIAPLAILILWQINIHLAEPMEFPMSFCVAMIACAVAFFLPNLWVGNKRANRRLGLEQPLPDAIDLLVTCVEAGLSLDAAMARVSQEMELVAPILAFFAVNFGVGYAVPMLVGTVVAAASVVVSLLLSPETKGTVLVAELQVA